ncbi:hypothetical protein TRFO_01200 [Tritrichomonas foetus]|uniref:Thioredoxin domain-containing protein n=1 Tax=Tritrichomonas foetus TaxID=1144522 RepID=A0A1J4KIR0_9EUKA|nr:hypothetical protein TRFO_01200 [Tritrichomonas foetus]|eukprot:OHT11239.1 hypothetical protein TRFO_01200 [Tritrichomonas foetus]
MILFLLSFIGNFTNETWYEMTNNSNVQGAIAFCYSPFCVHCQKTHPEWNKFIESGLDDSSVSIGSINCSKYRNLCMEMGISRFPTFFIKYHNQMNEVNLPYYSENFQKLYKRLVNALNGKYFHNTEETDVQNNEGNNEHEKIIYPRFVFTFDGNNSELIEMASNAIVSSDLFIEASYEMRISTETKLTVNISENRQIKMDEEFTELNILSFLRENSHSYLGKWTIVSIKKIKRKYFILATNDDEQFHRFENVDDIEPNKYVWGSSREMTTESFSQLFDMNETDYPAIIYVLPQKRLFCKSEKINDISQVKEFIQRIENDEIPESDFLEIDVMKRKLKEFQKIFIIVLVSVISAALLFASAIIIYINVIRKPKNKED